MDKVNKEKRNTEQKKKNVQPSATPAREQHIE